VLLALGRAWTLFKLEAWKMPENAAETHTSGARFVGTLTWIRKRVICFLAFSNF